MIQTLKQGIKDVFSAISSKHGNSGSHSRTSSEPVPPEIDNYQPIVTERSQTERDPLFETITAREDRYRIDSDNEPISDEPMNLPSLPVGGSLLQNEEETFGIKPTTEYTLNSLTDTGLAEMMKRKQMSMPARREKIEFQSIRSKTSRNKLTVIKR